MSPKKTTKPPVQTTLSFRTTKLPAGGSGKDKAKAVSEGTRSLTIEKPTTTSKPEPVVEKPKKKTRSSSVRSESSDDDSAPEFYNVPEDSDDEQDAAEQPEERPDTVRAPVPVPEVITASEAEDEDAMETKKAQPTFGTLKELLKDESFKDAYKEAIAKVTSLTDAAQGERKAKTILRVFDLDYDYGPCVGMTREERWNRAEKLGLHPPKIVRVILDTGRADKLTDEEVRELEETVFEGQV